MKAATRITLCLSALFWTAGCTSNDSNDDTADPAVDYCAQAALHMPTLLVGTGTNEFSQIEPTDVLTPAWGPQGGHHIWAAVQTTGINPGQGKMVYEDTGLEGYGYLTPSGADPVLITLEVSLEGNEMGPYNGTYQNFLTGSPEQAELNGLTAIIDAWGIVARYEEQESIGATLWVSVVDGCGNVVTDSKPFIMNLENIEGIYD